MKRNLIALGVLAVLVLVTALVYKKPVDEEPEKLENPWHKVEKPQVTKIVIQKPGGDPAITLEKRDDKWVMAAPAQGPADQSAISEALDSLTEMKVVALAAQEAGSHERLEVDDAHAIHLQLFRNDASVLDIFVGKNLDSGSAVRVPGSPRVYRVDQAIRFSISKEVKDWRDRSVTHLERPKVQWVEWVNPRGTFRFDKSGDSWTPATANPVIERLDTAKLNQSIVNLLDLRAVDFAQQGADTGLSATSPKVTFHTDDNASTTLRVGNATSSGDVYVQREGSDVVFTLGRTHKTEIDFDPASVQQPLPVEGGTATPDATAPSAAAPPFRMGPDGGLPPEIMQQLQRQIQNQMHGGGGPQ